MKRILLFILCCGPLSAATYAYKATITLAQTTGASDLTNRTNIVYMSDTSLKTTGHGGQIQNTVTVNGTTCPADLIFTSDTGGTTLLNWACELYDGTNGIYWAHVKKTTSHTGTTPIYVFWGNASITTWQGNNTAGGNTGYAYDANTVAAYALSDASASGTAYDLSPSALNASYDSNGSLVTAQVANGLYYGAATSTTNAVYAKTTGTMEVWLKSNAGYCTGGNSQGFVVLETSISYMINGIAMGCDGSGNAIALAANNDTTYTTYTGTTTITPATWTHMAITYTAGGTSTFYVNGTAQGTFTPSIGSLSGAFVRVGLGGIKLGNYLLRTDQFVFSSVQRSADWIAADYNNQLSPATFAVVSGIGVCTGNCGAASQGTHPRIWLDSTNLSRLQALENANDPTWTAFKAHADALLAYSIPQLGYVKTGTYVSGGSFSGTGTCNISFNAVGTDLGSGATGTIAVTSGTPGSTITITNGGRNYVQQAGITEDPPTSGTLSSGTATCSGTATVTTYVDAGRNNCGPPYNSQVCFNWEGSGWNDALASWSLGYAVNGDSNYLSHLKTLLGVMVNAGYYPLTVDQTFPIRYLVPYVAMSYDWIYSTLSASTDTLGVGSGNDISNLTGLMDAYWTYGSVNGYQFGGSACVSDSNYWGAAILGYGLSGIAIEGDDATSTTMQNGVIAKLQSCFFPDTTTGHLSGGFPVQGWNYGSNHFNRVFQYFWAMHTAGKDSLLTYNSSQYNYAAFEKTYAKGALYDLRPASGYWRIEEEGDWPGSWTGVALQVIPAYLQLFLSSATEGGWMSYWQANLSYPGAVGTSDNLSTYDAFLTNISVSPVNFTSTLPTYYLSPGDFHSYVRSDWTTSAVETIMNGDNICYTCGDHQSLDFGHLTIFRGADPLLIGAPSYTSTNGWQAGSGVFGASWQYNTLFYDDTQANGCLTQSGVQYVGCQNLFGASVVSATPIAHKETANYSFEALNLTSAYGDYNGGGGTTPLTSYYRTWVNVNANTSFIYDSITPKAPAGATIKQMWHVPTSGATTGSASALTYNQLGTSRLWIATPYPSNATFSWVADSTTYPSGGSSLYAQRLEVADPNSQSQATTRFLNVFAPLASGSSAPTVTSITPSGWIGASYDDGVNPVVVMMTSDGTSKTGVSYTATIGGGETARHVILNLVASAYSITQGGSTIGAATAASDGSLTFTSTGGGAFVLSQSGGPTTSVFNGILAGKWQ